VTIWSLAYLRFWIVRSLLVASPLALLSVGTPLLNVYLRALGAKVGRGAVIFTGHVPVVTDLLAVGPGTVIRKACYLNGYRARGGVIEIAPVTLGADVFVGEQTVLDIGTGMGGRCHARAFLVAARRTGRARGRTRCHGWRYSC